MRPTNQPPDPDLMELLDDLQLRVAHLEYLVLPLDDAVPTPAAFAAIQPADGEEDVPSAAHDTIVEPEATDMTDEVPGYTLPYTPPLRGATPLSLRTDGPAIDRAYIEERLAGRVLALVGGVALVLGAVFFLSLAFSRGWIGPSMQVALGLAGGSIGLAIGGLLLLRGDRIVGHVLSAVGLAVISLSLFAATSLYQLLDPSAGLGAILLVAALTTAIAIASHSQIVAGFGLTAVLAAPPLLGAAPDQITLAYMIVALAGVTAVSLWQTWQWLPPVAFLISAPQVLLWVRGEAAVGLVFGVLLGYWALLAVAAGGEAFRRRRPELTISSAPLLLAVGAFVIAAAFETTEAVDQRVAFLLVLAALHAIIAAWFAARRGPVDPFGLLAAAYGLAIASMAVPVAFGAALTAVVWSAEAAALATVAGRRAHGPSLVAAFVLLSLGCLRVGLLALEYMNPWQSRLEPAFGPFDVVVTSWAFVLGAAVIMVLAVPIRTSRLLALSLATLTTVLVIQHELTGLANVAASCALALLALSTARWVPRLPERSIPWQLGPALEWLRPRRSLVHEARLLLLAGGAISGALALVVTIGLTVGQVMDWRGLPQVPFSDAAGLAALLVAGTCLLGGWLTGSRPHQRRGIITAALVVGVAGGFQLPPVWVFVLWAGLGVALIGAGGVDGGGIISSNRAGLAGIAAALLGALAIAPPDRLVVGVGGVPAHPLLISEATLALGAVAVALALAARLQARAPWADWALAGAGVAGLYLLSVGVVDSFAAEAYSTPPVPYERVQELAKEAHVALSVTWAVVGVLLTGAGLILRRAPLRAAGLAVLGLATMKVFIFDLASLDIAYRVITLLVLGVLLIAIAWIWTRLKPASPAVVPTIAGAVSLIDLEPTPDGGPGQEAR